MSNKSANWVKIPNDEQGKQDAYRHCLASCENTRESGSASTFILGELNELLGDLRGQNNCERRRDMDNNAAGSGQGENSNSFNACKQRCLQLVNTGMIE